MSKNLSLQQEAVRKTIHIGAIWVPMLPFFLSPYLVQMIFVTLALVALGVDVTRLWLNETKTFLRYPHFGTQLRYNSEKSRVGRNEERRVSNIHKRPSDNPNFDLSELYILKLFRPHENNSLCGATFMMLSAALCHYCFSPMLFFLAFMILILSDSLAAIVGKRYGKTKILNKTVEGSLTFVLTALIIVIVYGVINQLSWQYFIAGICACIVATIAEIAADYIVDDNLLIPLSFCFTMLLLM